MSDMILFVDSKIKRRDMLASRFRLQGHQIFLANGGFHALNLIEVDLFKTVVIFEDLQDMPALELLTLLRSMFNKSEVQVIMVSKFSEQDEVLEAYRQGVNEFLIYDDKIFGPLLDKINKFKQPKEVKPKYILDQQLEDAKKQAEEVDSLGDK